MKESSFLSELARCCKQNEIITDNRLKEYYSFDAHLQGKIPSAVINVTAPHEIPSLLKVCVKYSKPIIPRGNASGQTGGAVTISPDTVIFNFSPLKEIISFNPHDRTVDVHPGVTINDLNAFLEPHNLFFPPDPASKNIATIGGAIGENAGGLRASQFGVTKNYVLSLSGYTVNGDFHTFGSHTLKDVAGYNIKDLIIGSEGTLFITTRATLRLLPIPKVMETMLLFFHNRHSFSAFLDFFQQYGYSASVMEIIDEPFLLELKKLKIPVKIPYSTVFALLLEFDDYNPVTHKDIRLLKNFLETANISFIQTRSSQKREMLWKFRRGLSQLLRTIGSHKFNEDICVPPSSFIEFCDFCRNLSLQYQLPVYNFGHLGDGNIHLNIITEEMDKNIQETIHKMRQNIFQKVISLQGSLSGEHGIGHSKKEFLPYSYPPASLEIFRQIKKVFDPEGLLNPEKIW